MVSKRQKQPLVPSGEEETQVRAVGVGCRLVRRS